MKIPKAIVVLRNCVSLLKILSGSYGEPCHDAVEEISIKDEDFPAVEDEMSLVPISLLFIKPETTDEMLPVEITFPSVIKAENEASCICVCFVIHVAQIQYCLSFSSVP
jgi:hypothetical protein